MGDKASLDRCGQQHRFHRRLDQEYPKTQFFFLTEKTIQNAKTQKRLEICQNQRYALRPEVSNPSGSVVSGWTKNTQKRNFFEQWKKSSKTQKLKNVQRYAKISDTPFDQRSLIHREAWFPPCFVRQNPQKNIFFLRGDFRPLPNKMFKCQTTSRSRTYLLVFIYNTSQHSSAEVGPAA